MLGLDDHADALRLGQQGAEAWIGQAGTGVVLRRDFEVGENRIFYSLAAIKGVGDAAVRHIVANTEDVGERFAEEARRMHYGEAKERAQMSLRSLLVAITIAAVVAMSVAVYVESSFVLALGFTKVERVQNAAVARLSQAVLSSEILALEDFSASIERDTSLARALLTARSVVPHSVKGWVSSGHCVASDIIPLDKAKGLLGWPVGGDSGVVVKALRGVKRLVFVMLQGRRSL